MYCFTDKWVWGPVLGLPQCFIAMFTIQHISGLRGLHCAWALPRILLAWLLVCLCFCLSLKPTPLYCGIYSRAITILDILADSSTPGIPKSGWWMWIFFKCLICPKMLSFTRPHVVPDLYDFLFLSWNKERWIYEAYSIYSFFFFFNI